MPSLTSRSTPISPRLLRAACCVATAGALFTAPELFAQANICQGYQGKQVIQRLGGPRSFNPQPVRSPQELLRYFESHETDLRTVLEAQGVPEIQEPLLAALRSGRGVSERNLSPGETWDWMALRRGGAAVTASHLCFAPRGRRTYEAYQVEVAVQGEPGGSNCDTIETTTYQLVIPKVCSNLALQSKSAARETLPPIPKPKVDFQVQRTCGEGSQLRVDASGSDPGVRVIIDGQTVIPGGSGLTWQGPDPRRHEPLKVVATAVNQDRCGREQKTEKVAELEACEPAAPVELPPAVEPEIQPTRERGHRWTIRPFLAFWDPKSDDVRTVGGTPATPERTKLSLGNGRGLGVGLEYHFNERLGLEAEVQLVEHDANFTFDLGTQWEADEDDVRSLALLVGPNFHLTPDRRVDFYLGPVVGLVDLGSADFTTLGRQFDASFDSEFTYGARLGLDVPFSAGNPWAFHAGLRYLFLEPAVELGDQESDLDLGLDPLVASVGVSYSF
jgi:outer membrane protein W